MEENKKSEKKVRIDPRRLAVKIIAIIMVICMVFSIAASLIFYFVYNS